MRITLSLYGLKFFVKMIKKTKLGNFYRPSVMEAQQRFEASLFQEIRKVVEGNNLEIVMGYFNDPDINWFDILYTNPTSGHFIDFMKTCF